jgi:hypothetical protein
MEATRHLGHAVVPDLVARDVERRCAVGKTQPAVNVEPTPLTLF